MNLAHEVCSGGGVLPKSDADPPETTKITVRIEQGLKDSYPG